MKVAFLKGTGILDWAIRLWTFSKYSHCELIFSDGSSFGTSLGYPFKTQFSHKMYPHSYWDVIEVDVPPEKEKLMKDFCWTQTGRSYDWTAILFSMILPFRQDASDKWICSEICVAAFKQGGYFSDRKPCRVSPGKFSKLVKSI
jgi:hypothetical protein